MEIGVLRPGERELRALREAVGSRAELVVLEGWPAVLERLISNPAPAALVVPAERLDDRGRGVLQALHARGLLRPTAIYFHRVDLDLLRKAWPLAGLGVRLLTEGGDLRAQVGRLLDAEATQVAELLVRRLGIENRVVRRLLALLAERGDLLGAPIVELAAQLRIARSTLYEAVASSGLPSIEQIQFLFRLLPAVRVLQAGGRAEDAAYVAGLADARSLRKVLRRRINTTIEDVRGQRGVQWLVERWITLHRRTGGGGADAGDSDSDARTSKSRRGRGMVLADQAASR